MKLLLRPIDTWFFRGSTPFTMEAAPQAGVRGVFPPYPSTIAGAIRAELARGRGWNGNGSWSETIKDVLGDGPEQLGRLQLSGPFLVCGREPVFPLPRHIVIQPSGDERLIAAFVHPDEKPIPTDLDSSIRLPLIGQHEPGASMLETAALWITLAGLRRVLRNQLPVRSDILHRDQLWHEELHVGIRRGRESRATGEGALYSSWHVRLSNEVGLGVEVAGVPEDWEIAPGSLLPLGGESRLAEYQSWRFDLNAELPLTPEALTERITLIALTPALIERDALCGACELIAGTRLRVYCACADRPLRIGGWDSLARRPLPLHNALSPGTTLFCYASDPSALHARVTGGMVRIGNGQSAGFGLFAIADTPGLGGAA
jgi:CRISPR-associated protein Cmr3